MDKIANFRALGLLFDHIARQVFTIHEQNLFDAQLNFLQERLYINAKSTGSNQVSQILNTKNKDGTYGIFTDENNHLYISEETIYAIGGYLMDNIQGICKDKIAETMHQALTYAPDCTHMKEQMHPIAI